MQNPQIKGIKKEENAVTLSLFFEAEAKYFQGHFPEIAILPGVIQVHFAMNFSCEFFGVKPDISSIKKLRFSKIIQPNIAIDLLLQHLPQENKIFFQYFNLDKIYSSGNFLLK